MKKEKFKSKILDNSAQNYLFENVSIVEYYKGITKISDIAFLIGEYYLTRSTENSNGYFTLFWKKIDNKWLIISDHTSAAK